ncbi:hypothetical protein AB0I45_06605 [Brevibacterium sp. NPDC049920]|uniref:Uncharacterized protein n=1 Tax=Brevibacterium pityocampae TaxID=506594 RepID=A0ABP8JC94_9MICO
MDRQWHVEAEVAPGIARIRAGEDTAWFLPGEPAAAEAILQEARGGATGIRHITVLGPGGDEATGVRVPRFAGGLLVDVLRSCGGLSSAQTIGVLQECLTALAETPAAPPGRTRLHRHVFALDAEGAIRTVPCHTAAAGAVEPQVELGEIGYLCLTGRTWTEAAIPVRSLRHAPAEPLAVIVIELLEAAAELDLDIHGLPRSLSARLAAAGDAEPFPFLPAEAAVPVADAVTAQIRIDAGYAERLAAAANGRGARGRTGPADGGVADDPGAAEDTGTAEPTRGGAGSARRARSAAGSGGVGSAGTVQAPAPSGVGRLRRAAGRRGATGRDGNAGRDGSTRRRRAQHRSTAGNRRSGRPRRWPGHFGALAPGERLARVAARLRRLGLRPLAAIGAMLAVVIGVLVLLPALQTEQRTTAGPSAAPGPTASGPSGSAGAEAATPESSPPAASAPPGSATTAAPELFDRDDPFTAFRVLTEARAAAYEAGDAEALSTLTVPGSPAARADARAPVEEHSGTRVTIMLELLGEPEADGDSARLAVRMHTTTSAPDGTAEDHGRVSIRVELRYGADGWRVYRITDGDAAGAG